MIKNKYLNNYVVGISFVFYVDKNPINNNNINLLPIVVSQNFPSATSLAKFAPIKTQTSIFRSRLITFEIKSMPPPSGRSKP